jgi:hypothetical protein
MLQNKLRRRHNARKVYPCVDAHPMQHVEQVFGRKVA